MSPLPSPRLAPYSPREKILMRAEVRQQVLSCEKCELRGECRQPVPGVGPTDPSLLVIGEAPGVSEDEQGRPFVGESGQLLRTLMADAGIDPDSCAYVNAASCLVGHVPVTMASPPMGGFRRIYSGEVLTIQMSSGRQLTVTPNHPILTKQGWVQANLLRPTDNLFSSKWADGSAPSVPYIRNGPSTAEQVFDALAETGASQWRRDARMNFHGDGKCGQVQVVTSPWGLGLETESVQTKPFLENEFIGSDPTGFLQRSSKETLINRFLRGAAAPIGSMGRTNDRLDLLRSHARKLHLANFWHAPQGRPQGEKPRLHCLPANPIPSGQRLDSFSGEIIADQILRISVHHVAAPVYNFSTREGWFLAGGIITHNCYPSRSKAPSSAHVSACSMNLYLQLALFRPSTILILGNTALSTFRPDLKVGNMRGRPFSWFHSEPLAGRVPHWADRVNLFVSWHPSACLRDESGARRRELAADLVTTRRWGPWGFSRVWPEDCVRCGREVDHYDRCGVGWCDPHWSRYGASFI